MCLGSQHNTHLSAVIISEDVLHFRLRILFKGLSGTEDSKCIFRNSPSFKSEKTENHSFSHTTFFFKKVTRAIDLGVLQIPHTVFSTL